MIDIIISMSFYIIAAILLGFTFGWFIAKAILKEKFKKELEILSRNYEANKNILEIEGKVQEKEISELKERIKKLKKQHDKELDAFLEEREDITTKYKELLEKGAN